MTVRTARVSGTVEGTPQPLLLAANGVDYIKLNTNGRVDTWDGATFDIGQNGDVLVHQGNNAPLWVTPSGGLAPEQYAFVNHTDVTLANVNTVQSLFGVGVDVDEGYWLMEYKVILLKTAGTTSHTVNSLIGGTSTKGIINVNGFAHHRANSTLPMPYVASAAESKFAHNAATAIITTQAITTAGALVVIDYSAMIEVTIAGTIIPQVQFSAAPGGTYANKAGGSCVLTKMGANGANVSKGVWA